ncbi:Stringent starvation protein B [Bosea sp. AAP35]|uniref:SspB family protein n=1 Tax=Bosea sp. AAP35 TaxID=1523417 RepID=UPI0006B9E9DB|nr:ClpXP protease specificity-enhancing factor SspB [Bosea sp. AAP35]KPF65982.1 Stringent starvation protein B [Bosea sp. AAP35]
MSKDVLRYDLMVQDALKGVVRKILTEAGRDGLPGDHHFYVTFRTTAPGVRVSQRLRDKHPEEMTIVLQHQFWDLSVGEHAFEVGLSFSGVPERLLVPFDAITTFFDPSVQFGLKFETQEAADNSSANDQTAGPKPRGAGSEPSEASPAPIALPVKAQPAGLPALKGKVDRDAASSGKGTKVAKSQPGGDAGSPEPNAAGSEEGGAQVVSLDAFRKKT